MTQSDISFKEVNESDSKFLYDLLKNRDPITNISHKKMPTFKEHKVFLNSHPYTKWYIILFKKRKVGSIYLSKQDEIGIFINKEFQSKEIGTKSLNLLMKKIPRKRYLANVSPQNKNSQKFFKNNDFKLIQYTYELIPKIEDNEKSN